MPLNAFVCVVILNYNEPQMTLECLESVLKLDYPNFRAIVVDNGSMEDSAARLKQAINNPSVDLLSIEKNEGIASGYNRGIEKALARRADYILALNNDTLTDPACLRSLVETMESNPRMGVAGCPIISLRPQIPTNYGQNVNLYTGRTSMHFTGEAPKDASDVDYICGAAVMLRAEVIRSIGMFDQGFFLMSEDADFCYRARQAGYRICIVPGPGVLHRGGATMSNPANRGDSVFYSARNQIWFVRRHGTWLHRVVFCALSFSYFFPRTIVGLFFHGNFALVLALLKGIWAGYRSYPA